MLELTGWIMPTYHEHSRTTAARILQRIGVKLGTWNHRTEVFENCQVSREAMSKLNPRWGEFIWGLE